MTKYRHAKIKRQHHVLRDLEPGLELIASMKEVDGIIPGEIRPKAGASRGFSFQYHTGSGLKLLGRSGGAAQEIFVITQEPDAVVDGLVHAGLIPDPG